MARVIELPLSKSGNENSVLPVDGQHLEGQYARRETSRKADDGARPGRLRDEGYAMASLLVSMALMGLFMTVAMPVWRHANQREKEAELLFRAGQYTRAIELFRRRYANQYPPNTDVLIQQRFLRKKYKDPITGGDFKFLSQLEMQAAGGAAVPGQQVVPGQQQRMPGRQAAPQREVTAQIAGVASRSTATSIRIYKNRQQYNQWIVTADEVFLRNTQAPGTVAQPGQQPGRPGQPGVGNQPGSRPGTSPGSFPGNQPGGQRPPGIR
jgi:type II secretory pathway pseudopilin PulG